jgi:EmrB/QacA subfamily drug resistance transporter
VTVHTITEREKRLTIAAIMTVFLLSALDQTVVSTAMPRIIAELHGLEMYSWTATAYMLTSTVMVPIYGKLGDMYGRKIILTVGVSIFLLGSALCGLAGEFGDLPVLGGGMVQLIFCRAIQGLGSGALFSGAFAVIGDLYPPRERGKVMGWFVAVFSISSVAGPTIGGFFTDHGTMELFGYTVAGWRWVFYVNLPLGLVALFLIIFKMHRTNAPTGGRVDYWGAFLLITAFVPLLLALTWGGNKYAWDSPRIIGLLTVSTVSLIVFVFVEARVSDPIMPLSLVRNKAFATTNAASFVINMAFFGVVMFMPLYMQLVLGVNATKSGFSMLPLMLGIMSMAMISGRYVRRTGRYKPLMIASCITLFIGVIFLAQIGPDTTIGQLNWRLLLVGLGLGPAQSLYSIAVQNAAPLNQLGIATSSSQFFRQIGSTVGIAIFGTILTHNLMQELPARLKQMPGMTAEKIDLGHMQARAMNPGSVRSEIEQGAKARGLNLDAATIDRVSHDVERAIKVGFSASIVSMLLGALWIVGLGLIITLFVPALPLREYGAMGPPPIKEPKAA